jgi:hypothetical protein
MAEKIIIKIKAHLDESWAEWFDKMDITYEGDMTVLSGENMDKAYLHGVLNRIRDLNLKLLSVDTKEDSEEK